MISILRLPFQSGIVVVACKNNQELTLKEKKLRPVYLLLVAGPRVNVCVNPAQQGVIARRPGRGTRTDMIFSEINNTR